MSLRQLVLVGDEFFLVYTLTHLFLILKYHAYLHARLSADIMDSPEFRSIDDVIGEVTFNKFHYVLLCLCGMGLCVDAMEVTSLSFINPCAGAEFALSDDRIAVRVTLSESLALEFVSLFLLCMPSRVLYVFSMQGLSGKVPGVPFPLQFNSTH